MEKVRPTDAEVISDGVLAMIAGADTTSAALASFWYFMLRNTEAYNRLREEVDKVYPPGENPMDVSRHDQLIWLNACM